MSHLQCFNFVRIILVIFTPRLWEGVSDPILNVRKLVTNHVDPVPAHLPTLLLTSLTISFLPLARLLCKYSVDPPRTLSIPMGPGDDLGNLRASPDGASPCQCRAAGLLPAGIVFFVKVVLPHAVFVQQFGKGIAHIQHFHLHKLALTAIPESMLKTSSRPHHLMHGPVFWQNAALAELLGLDVVRRYSRSLAKNAARSAQDIGYTNVAIRDMSLVACPVQYVSWSIAVCSVGARHRTCSASLVKV